MSDGGGEEFATGAELSIRVDENSLSDARDEIERELADIPIGVDASVSGAGGGGMQPRDPRTGQFAEIRGVEQRQLEANVLLEEILDLAVERNRLLDDMEDGGGGRLTAGLIGGAGGFAAGRGIGLGGVSGAFGRLSGAAGGALGGARGALGGVGRGVGGAANIAAGIPGIIASELERSGVIDVLPDDLGNGPGAGGVPPTASVAGQGQLVQDLQAELQVPEDFPPRLQTPPDFPPELGLPPDFPPELDDIGITVPSELQSLADGVDVTLGELEIALDATVPNLEQEVQSIIDSETQRLEKEIRRQFGVDLDLT